MSAIEVYVRIIGTMFLIGALGTVLHPLIPFIEKLFTKKEENRRPLWCDDCDGERDISG